MVSAALSAAITFDNASTVGVAVFVLSYTLLIVPDKVTSLAAIVPLPVTLASESI